MTNTAQRQITAGPSREELFDALRLRHESRTVTMTVENTVRTAGDPHKSLMMKLPRTFQVTVDSIGVEDGSGNNWLLTLSNKDGRFEGYFNTTRREGWLRPKN
mgnify:FL=1|jgi:hypothetical protein